MARPQTVLKRNGQSVPYDTSKVKNTIEKASLGFENDIDLQMIISQIENELFENITTKEITTVLILVVKGFIEKDPAYSKLASRLLLYGLYGNVFREKVHYGEIENQYQTHFINNIKIAAREKRLDPRILLFDLEEIAKWLQPKRDDNFQYLGLQILTDRYLIKNHSQDRTLETPQYFFMRVAMGLALEENDPMTHIKNFYEIMSSHRFMPSTPTLFHAGTVHPQLSSCYITTVQDSLDHIFKSVSDNAQMSKWSGGIGNDWTNIRSTGAFIQGTAVNSQGVIPFLKIANDTTVAINRSGRRRGATCAYLETWHYDIEDFLDLRKNTGDERRRTHDMDTAVWIPDLFMKRVKKGADWTLFSPHETPELHHIYGQAFEKKYLQYEQLATEGKMKLHKTIPAADLWKKIVLMNFETGHPWITFKDPCNVRSPQDHVGTVHSSNLCTEITLNTSEDEVAVCNLGSVNLTKHIKDGSFDKETVKETVNIAMRMLDNVIDLNFYPIPEARNSNMKHRPVGLGIMGFQDALYMMDLSFDSDEAMAFSDQSMEFIAYHAINSSSDLAQEKGAYKTFTGSKWDRGIMPVDTIDLLEKERGVSINVSRNKSLDWDSLKDKIQKNGMRNSNCMAIAPTATIANIVGTSQSIEPQYKHLYVKSNATGEFIVTNNYLIEDLKKLNLWNDEIIQKLKFHDGDIKNISEIPENLKKKYQQVFDINQKTLIDLAAARGKWIDQSQSLNIYFIGTSGRELSDIYTYAWDKGLKTTYYLRSLGATQVEKSTVNTTQFGNTHTRETSAQEAEPKLCKVEDPTCESCQ